MPAGAKSFPLGTGIFGTPLLLGRCLGVAFVFDGRQGFGGSIILDVENCGMG